MKYLSLNGKWEMRRLDESDWTAAIVPGSVYNDLLNNGKMEDPFYRDNERQACELSNDDYEYRRTFIADQGLLAHDRIVLSCEGLDTLAEVFLNGSLLAKTFNMHREYAFDISELLKPGENSLRVIFRSPIKYTAAKQKENPLWGTSDALPGISHLRKAHCMFGWDWGPRLPDMGIWRNIGIKAFNGQRFEDVLIRQVHAEGKVWLDVGIKVENWAHVESFAAVTVASPDGEVLTQRASLTGNENKIRLEIKTPQLWWPRGYGKQALYDIKVSLMEGNIESETREYRIGLRTLTVNQKPDQWGKSFAFEVNGVEIFSMGADYIPEDNILARCSREKTERLIKSCVQANFNTLRVWGGGHYPSDYFYDLCDAYGLIVWQDLMYACAVYELTDAFRENIRQETIDNMKRLRHHASLGLWCGNNEMEWGWVEWNLNPTPKLRTDYIKQFEVLLPEIAREVSPDTFYWLASPSSGGSFDKPNDENYGDMHDWSVWHGRQPFTYFRGRFPRFMSEFGMQSFPGMKTVETFTLPEDRNIFSYVMENHQKCLSGNEKIMFYISAYFKFPRDFESLLYISQLIQAESLRYGVEHWRRHRGRCMGSVYWQVNDCWPVASWASIDYYGRWKALQYAAKRFFAPVLASACEEGARLSLHVTNDTMEKVTGVLSWKLCDNTSKVLKGSRRNIEIESLTAAKFEELDFSDILDTDSSKRRHYVEYKLEYNGAVSQGTVSFVPAKHFELVKPDLKAEIEELEGRFVVTVTSKAYAKFVELDFKKVDALFADNYFDLSAGDVRKVSIEKDSMSEVLPLEELKKQLTVRSLIDSYV